MLRLPSTLFVIFVIITTFSTSISGRPTDNLSRHKRQSDQRLAELETLLALQKYRHHRLRPEHKGSQPGYGVIDFNTIGRRKKSTRFSPGVRSLDNVNQEDAFTRDANNLSYEEPFAASVDPSLNEKLDSLLSYKSIRQRKDKLVQESPQKYDVYDDKKK